MTVHWRGVSAQPPNFNSGPFWRVTQASWIPAGSAKGFIVTTPHLHHILALLSAKNYFLCFLSGVDLMGALPHQPPGGEGKGYKNISIFIFPTEGTLKFQKYLGQHKCFYISLWTFHWTIYLTFLWFYFLTYKMKKNKSAYLTELFLIMKSGNTFKDFRIVPGM